MQRIIRKAQRGMRSRCCGHEIIGIRTDAVEKKKIMPLRKSLVHNAGPVIKENKVTAHVSTCFLPDKVTA